LKPWDLERLQPADLFEMFDGLRWRWSRDLEARMTAAALIGNRIPMSGDGVDPFEVAGYFPLYRRVGEDD
jgi:hypothetical protein